MVQNEKAPVITAIAGVLFSFFLYISSLQITLLHHYVVEKMVESFSIASTVFAKKITHCAKWSIAIR